MMNRVNSETGQRVYDPRGIVEAEPKSVSSRVSSLTGLRIGVLDNTKWNGRRLLEKTLALLEADSIGKVTYYQKESFSKAATPDLIGRIAAESDAVITAIGD